MFKMFYFLMTDWRGGDQRTQEGGMGWTHSLYGESYPEGQRKHLY